MRIAQPEPSAAGAEFGGGIAVAADDGVAVESGAAACSRLADAAGIQLRSGIEGSIRLEMNYMSSRLAKGLSDWP